MTSSVCISVCVRVCVFALSACLEKEMPCVLPQELWDSSQRACVMFFRRHEGLDVALWGASGPLRSLSVVPIPFEFKDTLISNRCSFQRYRFIYLFIFMLPV